MRRAVLIGLVLLVCVSVAGCTKAPEFKVPVAELWVDEAHTYVRIEVERPSFMSHMYALFPSREAVLIDNLGNTYKVLSVDPPDMDGIIGGGIANPKSRTGILTFPRIELEEITTASVSLPIYEVDELSMGLIDLVWGQVKLKSVIWNVSVTWHINKTIRPIYRATPVE